ncbi:GNAT family N-acetyltransferase [Virgibacillus sp. C22-A2]|uniref:GNAT family N-acetyltransferase n=1 Tax=Virgibacillus tibetensis TaxID=3042313 RepID=A0ABU6KN10_9BACI|nr:GNAT family N-acetyltransferase [Virgibacillus sp. C22-A2]
MDRPLNGGITIKSIKKLTVKKDYEAIFSLSQFAFQYELTEAELTKKCEEAERHTIWGWMDADKLAAKLHLIPLSCYINGELFEMGGISAVATWPEYRRQGMVKHLLKHTLQEMKKNGQTLSFLHPFSISFYRKYGWELTFVNKLYSVPLTNLKKVWDVKGYVNRIDPDVPLLHSIYTQFATRFTGMLERDEKWWTQRVLKNKSHIAVAYNDNGEAQGYIIYQVKDNLLTVNDMAYTSVDGWKLLLQFIANHDSMAQKVNMIVPQNDNLSLLIDEPTFEQKIEPFFMARIVDVENFLKQYPFEINEDLARSLPLLLHIEDSFLPENSGVYELKYTNKGVSVTFLEDVDQCKAGIHCTIQLLTSLLLGYKRPMELYQAGLLQDELADIKRLEQLIPIQQTYFADFY